MSLQCNDVYVSHWLGTYLDWSLQWCWPGPAPEGFNSSPLDKISAISQMLFSYAFSWMTMHEFWLKLYQSLFIRVQLTIFQHWLRWWLGTDQATSYNLNQWWLVYWCIYVSLGLNKLRHGVLCLCQFQSVFIDSTNNILVFKVCKLQAILMIM